MLRGTVGGKCSEERKHKGELDGRVLHSHDNTGGEGGRAMAEWYTAMTIGEGREGYGRVLYSHDNRGGEGRVCYGYVMVYVVMYMACCHCCMCVLQTQQNTNSELRHHLISPSRKANKELE